MNTSEKLVLLRPCDAIDYHYRLADGRWHSVRYDGSGGNDGLPQPIVSLSAGEVAKFIEMGLVVRQATQEEHEQNIRNITMVREVAKKDVH